MPLRLLEADCCSFYRRDPRLEGGFRAYSSVYSVRGTLPAEEVRRDALPT
jgi:hypothetical protein